MADKSIEFLLCSSPSVFPVLPRSGVPAGEWRGRVVPGGETVKLKLLSSKGAEKQARKIDFALTKDCFAVMTSNALRDLIRLPSSAISLRPLRSLDRHDLFVPRARTSMAQTRAFAIIGPSLWNQLLPSTRSTLLTGQPSASFRSLKTALFSLGLSHWKRF